MNYNKLANLSEQQHTEIASRLLYLRTKVLQLNQQECAKALDISQTYLSLIETGKRAVSEEVIDRYIKIFEINSDWIIAGNGNINISDGNTTDNALYHIQKKQTNSLKNIKEAYTLDKEETEFVSNLLSMDKAKRKHFIRAIKQIKDF